MKKIIAGVCIAVILLGCYYVPTIAKKIYNETAEIEIISPENKQEIVLANDDIYNWYSSYKSSETAANAYLGKGESFYPKSIRLEWKAKENADYYNVKYSLNKDLSDCEIIVTNETFFEVSDLYTGKKYFWRVDAVYGDKTVRSAIHTFTTAQSPRTLLMDGVSNTRDIGGYIIDGSKRIKQGLVYRGAYFNEATASGLEQAVQTYKIKTDLDLRKLGEGGAGGLSPLGENVEYKNYTIYQYQLLDAGYFNNIKNAVKLFADESNYPIYIHCSLGRDRTGTLVFLIGGLLGMDKEQLFMEYDMSWFSVMGTKDNQTLSTMRAYYTSLFNQMESYSDGTLSENIEKYLLDIGITSEEIASIKTIMLEEVK